MRATLVAPQPTPAEGHAAAKAIGLRYATDREPGVRRERAGKGFRYLGPDGRAVRDKATLARIKRLAIPPAWTDVWIARDERAHLQATGRDARGRKQYRYHPEWRQLREQHKYDRMMAFGRALPRIRERVEQDLALPGLPREKVLATIVAILELTFMRVGNDEYARDNGSYGVTTLRDHHARIRGSKVHFRFRAKSGKLRDVGVEDPRLARIVKRCQDLPGQELFQYLDDDGNVRDVGSADVNDYLREISGEDFTAKDFRTWAGTVLCCVALSELDRYETKAQAKKNVVEAIKRVADRLGNTPAVCRRSYVHPTVFDAYLDGSFLDIVARRAKEAAEQEGDGLQADEVTVLALLQSGTQRQKQAARKARKKARPRAARRRAKAEAPARARR